MDFLVKHMIKDLIPEDQEPTKIIAVYGGGFKPATRGHFEVIKQALKENPEIDEFIVFIGKKEREGVTQDQSLLIWEIYNKYLPNKVKFVPSSVEPIRDIYRYSKNNPDKKILWVIGAREGNEEDFKDISSRTTSINKYPNIDLRTIVTQEGVSGTAARNAAEVSLEKLIPFLPNELNDEEQQEVYGILSSTLHENIISGGIAKSSTLEDLADMHKVDLRDIINQITIGSQEELEHTDNIDIAFEIAMDNIYEDPQYYSKLGKVGLEEGKQVGIIYHYTSLPNLKNILSQNKLKGSYINIHGEETTGVSTTRNKNFKYDDNEVQIVLDGDKLSNNYKILPNDYWRRDYNIPNNPQTQDEDEEVIITPKGYIENIKDYILSVDKIDNKESLQEQIPNIENELKPYLTSIVKHMEEKGINLKPYPKVQFIEDDVKNSKGILGKTAHYDPNTNIIVLYTFNRHPKDILRSYCHELIHVYQNVEDRLNQASHTTDINTDAYLTKLESEAYEKGNIMFRSWTDKQTGNKLNEEIDPSEAYEDDDAFQTLLDKKRNVMWAAWYIEPDFIKDLPKYSDIKTLKAPSSPNNGIIIYREGFIEQAKELLALVEKYGGYLPACEPCNLEDVSHYNAENVENLQKDIYRIGQLLGYKEDQIFNSPLKEINEIGDGSAKSYAYFQDEDSYFVKSYKFVTDKDTQYEVKIHIADERASIEFFTLEDFDKDDTFIRTINKGEIFRVMSTITSIIEEFIFENKDVEFILIDPTKNFKDDTRRFNLYKAYIKKNLPKGWIMDLEGDEIVLVKNIEQINENDPFGLVEFIKELAKEQEYKIYLDQDGVLADFDQRFRDLSGMSPGDFEDKYGRNEFWDFIDEKNKVKFWVGIPVMDGAKELVDFAKDYDYEILTSPSLKDQSKLGKRLWVKNHVGDVFPSIPKINFKFSKEKHTIKPKLTKYDILVDDKQRTIDTWNKAGGTGIFYKNTQQTISDLKNIVNERISFKETV